MGRDISKKTSGKESFYEKYLSAIDLVMRLYEKIIVQDAFLKQLREKLKKPDLLAELKSYGRYIDNKNINKYNEFIENLKDMIYCTHVNERVRLGIYKTLAIELYRIIYGNISYHKRGLENAYEDLIVHGSIIEYIKRLYLEKQKKEEIGLDYVILLNTENNITVPLFIIGKMELKDAKECFEHLIDAITESKNKLKNNPRNKKLLRMLGYFTDFVRIAILGTSEQIDPGKHEYKGYKVRIYNEFATSLLVPILCDLGEMYQRVLSDKFLRRLSVTDWIKLLFMILVPKFELDILIGDPPIPPEVE